MLESGRLNNDGWSTESDEISNMRTYIILSLKLQGKERWGKMFELR